MTMPAKDKAEQQTINTEWQRQILKCPVCGRSLQFINLLVATNHMAYGVHAAFVEKPCSLCTRKKAKQGKPIP